MKKLIPDIGARILGVSVAWHAESSGKVVAIEMKSWYYLDLKCTSVFQ
jgi:hypothetical protein